MLERARTRTGLDDFGSEDFREGLEILVRSMDTEAALNELGRAAMDAQVVDVLGSRLQVEDWYRRHPEIEEEEIVAPLIGLGLPRTGSTALACMLGEDRNVRSLLAWETMAPCPPATPETAANDPRIAQAEAGMRVRAERFPRMTAMLPSGATAPTECQLFMGQAFKTQIFQAFAHLPSYVQWLNHEADLVPAYQRVKRVLKLLQWRWPKRRWRLKSPTHSLFITALDKVFPDARFVMTHRDVASVVPSVADMYLELRKAFSDQVDTRAIGELTSDFCELGMRRMLAFRDAGQEDRFFDVYFKEFQQDPLASIERLYAFLGETLTEETRAAMEAWRRAMPVEAQRYERTDPAVFGLEAESLREKFKFYAERFRI